MLGSREAAEDALQLTFVSAFRALRRRRAATFRFGHGCIRSRAIAACLSSAPAASSISTRWRQIDHPSKVWQIKSSGGRTCARCWTTCDRLPADQRAALVLFELGDHSHEEIAAVLGVRKEKVKALVFQAREALVRGRRAREHPCAEIRERLATSRGRVLPRSVARAHIDRCPGCAAFEREVRRQRAALALILPVALTSGLKASVLGSALRGGGPIAAGGATATGGVGGAGAVGVSGTTTAAAGMSGTGAAAASGTTTAARRLSGAGAVAASGTTTAAAGVSGASGFAAGASAAGSVSAGVGAASTAVIAGVPSIAAVATGVTGVGTEYAASVGGSAGSVQRGSSGRSSPQPRSPPQAPVQSMPATARRRFRHRYPLWWLRHRPRIRRRYRPPCRRLPTP